MPASIIVISNDPGRLVTLLPRDRSVVTFAWESLPQSYSSFDCAVFVCAISYGQTSDRLPRLRGLARSRPILAVVPQGVALPFLRVLRTMVSDFVMEPVNALEMEERLERLSHWADATGAVGEVGDKLAAEIGLRDMMGDAPAFRAQIDRLPMLARTAEPVLITGETGTGKELCARSVHHLSPFRDGPLVAVDCASVPEHLVENELFGHVRGAYTDAREPQKGLVMLAHGGTLFLDEVDSLSLASQAKLLRFLHDRTFRPLGSERLHRATVRVVAATNRNLERSVADGQFRADLFFRLNVLRVELPPLRERRADILPLARHFLVKARAELQCAAEQLSRGAEQVLLQHAWPGNIRELENVVRRAAVLTTGREVAAESIITTSERSAGEPLSLCDLPADALNSTYRAAKLVALQEFERKFVGHLLTKHDGNISSAAREAGKERRAFGRLVKKLGLKMPSPAA